MTVRINSITDPIVAQFLSRVDSARGANTNGRITSSEAAVAARYVGRYSHWRSDAEAAFGLAPRSGAELLRFAQRNPKDEALNRILGQSMIAGQGQMSTRRGAAIALGDDLRGKNVSVASTGDILVDGKSPKSLRKLSTTLRDVAKNAASLNLAGLSKTSQKRLFATLSDALDVSTDRGGKSVSRQRLFAASMTLLIRLSKAAGHSSPLGRAITDRCLQGVGDQKSRDLKLFYLAVLDNECGAIHSSKYDPAQQVALQTLKEQSIRKSPPIEEYTEGRTKPLNIQHTIHEEFWKDELSYYSKKNGWKLESKNRGDTHRVYTGTIPDPEGKKASIKARVVIDKGELSFLDKMGDPDTHVIIYSGHSSLGANGSQAIYDAPDEAGTPKTVMFMECRGVDNYPEFSDRFPEAMLITTLAATYGDSEHRRIDGLFKTLAGGQDFEAMRRRLDFKLWDEPADNYIFPDEARLLSYTDRDGDGKIDLTKLGSDAHFDVDAKKASVDFLRAVAFVNAEYFYHWEVEVDNGKTSVYGEEYADSVVPNGPLKDPKPGEFVRLTPSTVTDSAGKDHTVFAAQYDTRDVGEDSRDYYAGMVMAQAAMSIAEHKFGKITQDEILRSVLMGAQAIYYLDVYWDSAPQTQRDYFVSMGLGKIDPDDITKVLEGFDTHANNEQLGAFAELLEEKYGIDVSTYVPPYLPQTSAQPAVAVA